VYNELYYTLPLDWTGNKCWSMECDRAGRISRSGSFASSNFSRLLSVHSFPVQIF